MSKEQKRRKYQHKQKSKRKETASEDKVNNLVVQLAQSNDATSAFKRALQKTIKE